MQNQLNKNGLKLDKLQNDLEFCNNSSNSTNSTNYILEQSIPLKSENRWVWLSLGIIGGFTTCHLLNL